MTDTPMQPRTIDLVEPDDDEAGDLIQFVKNGWIRYTIAGVAYKLRRPFLGELRQLEASKEAGIDDLDESNKTELTDAEKDMEKAKKLQKDAQALTDSTEDQRKKLRLDKQASDLARKAMKRQQLLIERTDEFRVNWWAEVFKTLTPPGNSVPTDVPAWVTDPMLMEQVLAHWRTAPLAYGSG